MDNTVEWVQNIKKSLNNQQAQCKTQFPTESTVFPSSITTTKV